MEKNILRQYDSIKKEIEETERRIQSTRDRIRSIEAAGLVCDSVKGGMGGTEHYHIKGYPSRDIGIEKTRLMMREARLSILKEDLMEIQEKSEIYIAGMTDSECRRIASFRYIDNLSWKNTAKRMGNGYTEDGCRMMLDRYIKKVQIKNISVDIGCTI